MEIKICGIRREEDIEIINKYKPDYIGFIFAESKRKVSPEMAKKLSSKLVGDTKTVGVFVNAAQSEVKNIAETVGLDVVQLHGDEDEEYIKSLDVGSEIWKAVRVKNGDDINDVRGADRLLLDKYTEKEYGGSGKVFDWTKVGTLKTDKPIILAGGLSKENVAEGIRIFNPVCVDVSSSVETDGFKDEKKIKEFIDTVRNI
jgi:phosphoribosylanthranilate isomerase